MNKEILKFYDKMILALLVGLFALSGCSIKKYVVKKQSRKQKTVKNATDSISSKIKTNADFAIYGVYWPNKNR